MNHHNDSTSHPSFAAPAGEPIAKAALRGCEVPRARGIFIDGQGQHAGNLSRREAAFPSAGMAGPMDSGGGAIRRRPFPVVMTATPREGPNHA